MKRFFATAALLGSAIAMLFTTACGDHKCQNPDVSARENPKTGKVKIGISIPSADHGWTGGVVYWAERAKKDLETADPNVTVLISTAKDSAEQMDKIENLMVQGIDALVVLPQEPGPLTGICEKVYKKGVRTVVVDRGLNKNVYDLLVAGDNPGFGRVAAELMAKELGGKGNVVVMEGVPCQVNTDRVEAFKAVMKQYPEITILDSGATEWKTELGLKVMENFLQKYPQIDAVWAGDDDVLVGALKAYENAKRSDVKLFVGGGGSKTIVKRILDKDPMVRMTVTYPPKMIHTAAGEALKLLRGNKRIVVPAEVVNESNAEQFYYPESAY